MLGGDIFETFLNFKGVYYVYIGNVHVAWKLFILRKVKRASETRIDAVPVIKLLYVLNIIYIQFY